MIVIDTNVLVHAVVPSSIEHAPCRALVNGLRGGASPWHLTWNVAYELVRVLTHPRSAPRPVSGAQATGYLTSLVDSPSFSWLVHTDRHAEVLALTLREVPRMVGNRAFDLHTAVLMREHGVRRIATLDVDFRMFPFVEIVDPTVDS